MLQIVISWQSLDGGWLQRVVTRRLSITSNLQAWLTGTDWNLASVLAAKRCVKDAQAGGAAQNRKAAELLRRRIGIFTSHSIAFAALCATACHLACQWLQRQQHTSEVQWWNTSMLLPF